MLQTVNFISSSKDFFFFQCYALSFYERTLTFALHVVLKKVVKFSLGFITGYLNIRKTVTFIFFLCDSGPFKTSISFFFFFKKLAGRLSSIIACTLMTFIPHMMEYVLRVTELTKMTSYFPSFGSPRTVKFTSDV